MSHPGWCENLVLAGRMSAGESVLVVVDEPLAEEGSQLLAALRDAGGDARLELWAGTRPLALPPDPVLEAARTADLALFLSQAPRADEADARFELMETVIAHGGREIYLGLVDHELLAGELSQPMPDLSEQAVGLLAALESVETMRIRTAAGTDLELRVGGRSWKTDAVPLTAGEVANFPGGEIFVAPHADGADGVLVVDLTIPYGVAGLVDQPVTISFEDGRATSIEGGRSAQLLRELVAGAGSGADVVAELGIGLNPAVAPRGHTMLDEKAANTAHVAIGRNTGAYGGDNEASIHVDCIFSNPQIEADGRPLPLP
jgi:leucyl aminopeptidase (aminopeptidase T)